MQKNYVKFLTDILVFFLNFFDENFPYQNFLHQFFFS